MPITITNRKNIRMVTDFTEPQNGQALPAVLASVAMTNPGPVAIDTAGAAANGQAQVKPAAGGAGRLGYVGYNPDPSIGLGGAVSPIRGVLVDGFTGVSPGLPVFVDETSADNSGTSSGLTHTAPNSADVATHQVDLAVAVAATTSFEFVAPVAGTISGFKLAVSTNVAGDDTNYWTFAVVNKSNANAAVLANTNANTTKLTGGTPLVAYTPLSEALSGTGANLVVNAGDVIEVTATKTASGVNLTELVAQVQITRNVVTAVPIGLGWTGTKIFFN